MDIYRFDLRCYTLDVPEGNWIYCIYNKITDKGYIGSAVDLKRRLREHLRKLHLGKHNGHLQNAWNKYGEQSFEIWLVDFVKRKSNVKKKEQEWIDFMVDVSKKYNENKFYNISLCSVGGNGKGKEHPMWGRRHTALARSKICKATKGKNNPMYGIKLCGEANGMFGKHHTAEARKMMSEAVKGKNHPMYGKPAWNRGIPHTAEARRKMSETHNNRSYEEKVLLSKKLSKIHKERFKNSPMSKQTRERMSEARKKWWNLRRAA